MASATSAITSALAIPLLPYADPIMTIPVICINKRSMDPTTTILLFSFPKNFEMYINTTVCGIIAKPIIEINSTVFVNCGKNNGKSFGIRNIVNIAKIIDPTIVVIFSFLVYCPTESRGSIYR